MLTASTCSSLLSAGIICAFWFIKNSVPASPPSVGFPGYMYPNQEICDMYDGEPCEFNTEECCYNMTRWCPDESSPDCFMDVRRLTSFRDGYASTVEAVFSCSLFSLNARSIPTLLPSRMVHTPLETNAFIKNS